jgi:cyclic beta-1,2-glucan synthetase
MEAMFAANDAGAGPARRRVRAQARPARAPTRCSCCGRPRASCAATAAAAIGPRAGSRPTASRPRVPAPMDPDVRPRAHAAAERRPRRRHPVPSPRPRRRPSPAVAPDRGARAPAFDNGFGGLTPAATTRSACGRPRAARAVGERDRQPARRLRGQRARRGLHLGGSSYFFRLTPWHNDPVSDPVSEVLYLRDEETPASLERHAGAARGMRAYVCATAPARSVFEHEHGRHRHPAHAGHGGRTSR